jgi:hypothetical protein
VPLQEGGEVIDLTGKPLSMHAIHKAVADAGATEFTVRVTPSQLADIPMLLGHCAWHYVVGGIAAHNLRFVL